MPGDDHHLLERFRRRHELLVAQAKALAAEASNGNGRANGHVRDPVDAVRLCGIPAVGSGAAGAVRGSIPHLSGLENVRRRPRLAST